jgi:hypothetical protein
MNVMSLRCMCFTFVLVGFRSYGGFLSLLAEKDLRCPSVHCCTHERAHEYTLHKQAEQFLDRKSSADFASTAVNLKKFEVNDLNHSIFRQNKYNVTCVKMYMPSLWPRLNKQIWFDCVTASNT